MGAVVALGNFDGVHRGHQELIAAAKKLAVAQAVPLVALTFEPHPRRFFAPNLPPFRLTSPEQKQDYLRAAGCDTVRVLTFDAQLAAMPAETFVQQVLVVECGACIIVAGEDFRFGHDRLGDMARMAEWLHGTVVTVHPVTQVRDPQGQRYAASTVRSLLQNGQAQAAAAILGRPYTITGTVAHGDQRGRGLGFPTANFALADYQRPQYGVYAVQARRVGTTGWVSGVANIGRRPTVDGLREWLEVHLFDFAAEIYDEVWEIALIDFIRAEQRFSDLTALKQAVQADIVKARTILNQQ